MHIDIRPYDRNQTYQTADDAIAHLIRHAIYPKDWSGVQFGRDMADIRRATIAIKAKDATAFQASRRRGYWRVTLTENQA